MGRVYKKVVNLDHGGTKMVTCAWGDCENDGYENHKITVHEHAKSLPCDHPLSKHVNYVFCSNRHRDYWGHSSGWRARVLEGQHNGRIWGMLPTGSRGSIL